MNCTKSLAFIVLSLATATATEAFSFVSHPQTPNVIRSSSALAAKRENRDGGQISPPTAIRNFVALSAITLGLLSPSSDALAAQDPTVFPPHPTYALHSSTLTLSEVIRTMDFSLPSSYDSISDPVASGTEELTTSMLPSAKSSSTPKKTAEKTPKSGSTGGRSMGISMPKLELGGSGSGDGGRGGEINSEVFKSMTADQKAAVLAQRRAEREQAAAQAKAEAAVREKQAIEERNAKIAAERLERIAKRQEEEAKKQAAEAEKREEVYKGAKIVDTSMPAY